MNLNDLSLQGKRVLMRVDFNVPMRGNTITDDSRIRASLPSIEYVLAHGASLVLMSHLGRPKGPDPTCSLKPCAQRPSELLRKPVAFAPDCMSGETAAKALQPGQVLLLENLRFHPGEENPDADPQFAQKLSRLGNVYVNDAFGTAHRDHASVTRVVKYFPDKAAMGFLMEREVLALKPLLEGPKRPFYAVMGGAKLSTKLGVIKNLLPRLDGLFLGGGMTYPFLKARGVSIGSSLCDGTVDKTLLNEKKIHLPVDLVITDQTSDKIVSINDDIPDGWQGVDVGPKTIEQWCRQMQNAGTVFWNGPVGVFENPKFAVGTKALAEHLATLCRSGTDVIIGGGDSVAAVDALGLQKQFTHLSTGGGASLEYLEFGKLPGLTALSVAY